MEISSRCYRTYNPTKAGNISVKLNKYNSDLVVINQHDQLLTPLFPPEFELIFADIVLFSLFFVNRQEIPGNETHSFIICMQKRCLL